MNGYSSACGLQKEFGPVFALHSFIQHAVNDKRIKLEASFKRCYSQMMNARFGVKTMQQLARKMQKFKWNVDGQIE